MRKWTVICFLAIFFSCHDQASYIMNYENLDIQGHRGCRGLMPENTIPAFLKALNLGVNTLEMDLVISKDLQVVVSHDPYFSHEISRSPSGQDINLQDEKEHNIFQLTYDQIQEYDVGSKAIKKFRDQNKMKLFKPLFKEVVLASEHSAKELGRTLPFYNIEIKRKQEWDGIFHPGAELFTDLVLEQVEQLNIADRVIIQSFDYESLRLVKQKTPSIKTSLLVENLMSHQDNVDALGFIPDIYSPAFQLVNKSLKEYCLDQGIKLLPWTVNKPRDIKRMLALGVDGMISDYPDRVIEIARQIGKS